MLHFRKALLMILPLVLMGAGAEGKTKTTATIEVSDLKADHETDPTGIDRIPQLSWEVSGNYEGVYQSAYRVMIASSPELLSEDVADIHDSGKVMSAKSTAVTFPDIPFRSRTRYYWKVKIWDEKGTESPWSEISFYETALLDGSDWHSGWIGYVPGMPGRVLYFKGSLFADKAITRARAYFAGLGFSELHINGKKVGDSVLDPAQSTYSKHVYYRTYDITDYLHKGANSFVLPVAPGWLGSPRLRIQVEISYEDGTQEIMTSDRFRSVITGPIMYSTVFDGEIYDARLENDDIYKPGVPPGLMNKQWAWAHNTDDPVGKMACQRVEPIRIVEEIIPKIVAEPAEGSYVFDAGRNLAGWAAIRTSGEAGTTVRMRFAETLYDNGEVNQENLRNAKSEDIYILKGEGIETWEPSFTYHGFRYVQIDGLPSRPAEGDIVIKVVRSDVRTTGEFSCSNQLLNDIHRMVYNTEASNLHSVPTDCPQRDERMGWLNDMTVRIEQAIYNFDMSRFYPKFLTDITDTQDEYGTITCVAPFRFGMRPADPVCASYLILAEKCYEFYGDRQVVEENYSAMKGWTDYLLSRSEDGILEYSYYGDWCPPREFLLDPNGSGVSRDTPGALMSTGYLYYCSRLIAKMAGILGKTDDAARYGEIAARVKEAFNRKYWNEQTGGYASNNQACNSFAIYLGMPSEEMKARALDNLVKDVQAHDYHLTTGNLCTKYLLEVLSENGHEDVAYRIATQTTYPSWGFMLSKGATTLWERWEYLTGDAMNSHNHPMMGSVGSWFYKYLLGIIPDFDNPGFSVFTIKPCCPEGLDSAQGSLDTVKGKISVSWERKGRNVTLRVTVPGNSKAIIHVPGKATPVEAGSGEHVFKGRI